MSLETWDEEREDYFSLVEEASAEEAHPWNDDDWEPRAVAHAKAFARKHDLSWPPKLGDFDMVYEMDKNGEL